LASVEFIDKNGGSPGSVSASVSARLLEGEDPAAYDELLARIAGTVMPTDILEEIWVRDIVDLSWDVFRWHRLKADLIKATALREPKLFSSQSLGTCSTTSVRCRYDYRYVCYNRHSSRRTGSSS